MKIPSVQILITLILGSVLVAEWEGPALAQQLKTNSRAHRFMEIQKTLPALTVNGATITNGQVEARMNRLKRRDFLNSTKVVEDMTPASTRQFAEDLLIEEYIAIQLAAREGITVSTEEVATSFQRIGQQGRGCWQIHRDDPQARANRGSSDERRIEECSNHQIAQAIR